MYSEESCPYHKKSLIWYAYELALFVAVGPGVDQGDAARYEVPRVTGHDPQAVADGRCRDEQIRRHGRSPAKADTGGKLAPDDGGVEIDFDKLVGEPEGETSEPQVKFPSSPPLLQERDAFLDLSHRDHADEQVGLRNPAHRRKDGRIGIRSSQFADDTGIHQRSHRSTSRISA